MISSLYQLIYYGREDPQFFIDPQDLDSILRVHHEPFEFNHPALCQVLESLCGDREESPFYAEVKRTQAEHSQGFLKQKHQAQLEMHHRRELVELWKSRQDQEFFYLAWSQACVAGLLQAHTRDELLHSILSDRTWMGTEDLMGRTYDKRNCVNSAFFDPMLSVGQQPTKSILLHYSYRDAELSVLVFNF